MSVREVSAQRAVGDRGEGPRSIASAVSGPVSGSEDCIRVEPPEGVRHVEQLASDQWLSDTFRADLSAVPHALDRLNAVLFVDTTDRLAVTQITLARTTVQRAGAELTGARQVQHIQLRDRAVLARRDDDRAR